MASHSRKLGTGRYTPPTRGRRVRKTALALGATIISSGMVLGVEAGAAPAPPPVYSSADFYACVNTGENVIVGVEAKPFSPQFCSGEGLVLTQITGPQGFQGAQGNQGFQGVTGSQGATGTQGNQGFQGQTGAQGNQGFQGNQGAQGVQGSQGRQGAQGSGGAQGVQGVQGAQGAQGLQGSQGRQGAQGNQGPQGPQGAQGAQGLQGSQGFQGFQGATGPAATSTIYTDTQSDEVSVSTTLTSSVGNLTLPPGNYFMTANGVAYGSSGGTSLVSCSSAAGFVSDVVGATSAGATIVLQGTFNWPGPGEVSVGVLCNTVSGTAVMEGFTFTAIPAGSIDNQS